MKVKGNRETLIKAIWEISEGDYVMDIRPLKTRQQDKMLWKLIRKIAKETGQTLDEVYAEILERADVSSEFIIAIRGAESTLREVFRFVRRIRPMEDEKWLYQCFYGQSVLTRSEAAELVMITQELACELGVDDGEVHNA